MLFGNFRDVAALLAEAGVPQVDGLLADLECRPGSSIRRSEASRSSTPGRRHAHGSAGPRTALDVLRASSAGELADVVRRYGGGAFAGPIARAMKAWAEGRGAPPAGHGGRGRPARQAQRTRQRHPATRTFQALRMAVNDELGALDALLAAIRPAAAGRPRADHQLPLSGGPASQAGLLGLDAAPGYRAVACPRPGRRAAFIALTRKPVVADEALWDHRQPPGAQRESCGPWRGGRHEVLRQPWPPWPPWSSRPSGWSPRGTTAGSGPTTASRRPPAPSALTEEGEPAPHRSRGAAGSDGWSPSPCGMASGCPPPTRSW
ncbi:MAG: 16S rRNA (cytosine(1402)-N(4))-methyltransferase [bacterium]